MSKDEITKTKIETAKVREAIESLKSKDWDLNPYTVADELEIDRDELVRNAAAQAAPHRESSAAWIGKTRS